MMKSNVKEAFFLGLTAARLADAADHYKRVKARKPIVATTARIFGADLLDGLLADIAGVDGPKRRALDSAADSAIIAAGLAALYKSRPNTRPIVAALTAREVFVASGWALDLATSNQVKKGDIFHRGSSFVIAMFGLAASHGSEKTMKRTGYVALGYNALLAYDYFKGWTQPERNTPLDTGVVEVPGFYGVRTAAHRLIDSQLQLGFDANPPLELEAQTAGPYIDATCFELADPTGSL
jgi:hypothetical protein